MNSNWFLWMVALLIGTALTFPPAISAAEKKMEAMKEMKAKMKAA